MFASTIRNVSSFSTTLNVNQKSSRIFLLSTNNTRELKLMQNNHYLFTNYNFQRLTQSEIHCINVVKKFDYENFLATLFISGHGLRRTAFVLRAFNVELAQVRDTTKTDELAQIRFQFWQDVIEKIYLSNQDAEINHQKSATAKYTNFPLASELYHVLSSGKQLSKHWILKLIQIRRDPKYLGEFPFQTLDELEKYSEASIVSLYYLLNEKSIYLSSNNDHRTHAQNADYQILLDHLANHLGKAQGLTNVLRGIIHNAKSRRCYIPNDILVQSQCSHEAFLQCQQGDDSIREAVFIIASRANGHLEHALELLRSDIKSPKIRKQDRLIFLPIVTTKSYLQDLQRLEFNIFDQRLFQRRGFLPWKLWWNSRFTF